MHSTVLSAYKSAAFAKSHYYLELSLNGLRIHHTLRESSEICPNALKLKLFIALFQSWNVALVCVHMTDIVVINHATFPLNH